MPWVSKVALRMRSLLRPDALDHEHDDALRFPVEQQIAENIGPETCASECTVPRSANRPA
jgi:hypothetical protein